MCSSNSRDAVIGSSEPASTGHHTTSNTPFDSENVRPASLEAPSEDSVSVVTQSLRERVDDGLSSNDQAGMATFEIPASSSKTPPWLPYTLRWIPLSLILVYSLFLDVAVIIVHAVSSQNSGLVDDSGSKSIVIGSKFVPTLLVVTYNLLLTILLDDIKRTEPFARLALPLGTTAKLSLAWIADTWWHALYRSFPSPLARAKWALPCTTIAFILGSLALSPLSSSLFIPQDVVFNKSTPFLGLDLDSSLPLQPNPLSTTYFRTISNILQNVSTSAWITDKYVVLPFWPSHLSTVPLSPILSNETEIWTANTTIFSVDLACESLSFRWDDPPASGELESDIWSLTLASQTGCILDINLMNLSTLSVAGGEIWSQIHSVPSLVLDYDQDFRLAAYGCDENEMLVYSKGRESDSESTVRPDSFMGGQVCQATYYIGHSTATVTLRPGQSLVQVNELEYQTTKSPVSAIVMNTTGFDTVFFDSNWTTHLDAETLGFDPIQDDVRHWSIGPANLLAPLYQFRPEIIANHSIVPQLERIRRRFFAEVLHNIFENMAQAGLTQVPGSVLTTSRRIVVPSAIAIALEVILSLQAVILATVLYLTRSSRRPLGLTEDPAPVVNVARLISRDPLTITTLTKSSNGTKNGLETPLSGFNFKLAEGQIKTAAIGVPDVEGEAPQGSCNKLPAGKDADEKKKLRLFAVWSIVLLFIVLVLTLSAVAALYHYSKLHNLYQTIFVYNINITANSRSFGQVNPASLITTLLAVIVSLWWGSFDVTLRRAQPYLALAKAPVPSYKGVAVSYRSSYMLWAAYRAAKRNHWILFFISTGTFLSQILTIAMSSLWTRAPGTLYESTTVSQSLKLRSMPMIATVQRRQSVNQPSEGVEALRLIFEKIKTSWIYGATTQLTLQGPEPPWSSDDWSFIPPDLSVVFPKHFQDLGNGTSELGRNINVTTTTPGIRARLECSSYENINNETLWLAKLNLTDQTDWDGTVNPKNLTNGYEIGIDSGFANSIMYLDRLPGFYDTEENFTGRYTNIGAYPGWLQCCENTTDDSVGLSSVGYWTLNDDTVYKWPNNFTVKWFHGRPFERIKPHSGKNQLIWVEPPHLTTLNCQPLIEYANAHVTADATNGRVISYDILEVPHLDEHAWTHAFDRPISTDFSQDDPPWSEVNVSISHGVLFVSGLLGAAHIKSFTPWALYEPYSPAENLEDQTFNFREPGLNVDYMTYAMLSMVNFDHQQLLDVETMKRTAQHTFSTMFQHFVNSDFSLTEGGKVYQPRNQKFPDNIGQRGSFPDKRMTNETKADSQEVTLHISRPAEILYISEPAAWICMVILGYLAVSCGVLAVVSRRYNRMLPGPTNSIADTAALVAGSSRLLEMTRNRSTGSIKGDKSTRAKLNWFTDSQGKRRWGIELVDVDEET